MADGEVTACVRFKIEAAILTDSCLVTGHLRKKSVLVLIFGVKFFSKLLQQAKFLHFSNYSSFEILDEPDVPWDSVFCNLQQTSLQQTYIDLIDQGRSIAA